MPAFRVRRSRHLVSYWIGGALVFTNYATGASVVGDPMTTFVLTVCEDWTTLAALEKIVTAMPRATLRALLRTMVVKSLMVRSDRPEDPRDTALRTWDDWNPAAGLFHFTTKDMAPPPDLESAEQALRADYAATGSPDRFKRYPTAATVALPPERRTGEFADVLLSRRTWRSFSNESISLDEVATLLGLTCRVQRTAQAVGLGPGNLATSPSSGARHPIEAYLLAVRVDGLSPGLYHYATGEHLLERIKRGASRATIRRYIPGQWWYDDAAALLILSAVFPRSQWRYRFPRAYRSVLLEAGHTCQTFCLAATWLGLAPFCTARFADSLVESAVGADGITKSFVYGGGVGRRPPGFDWAPWPLDHSPHASPSRKAP